MLQSAERVHFKGETKQRATFLFYEHVTESWQHCNLTQANWENICINLTTHVQHLEKNALQRPQCNTLEKSDAHRPQHKRSVFRGHLKVLYMSGHTCCWCRSWVTPLLRFVYCQRCWKMRYKVFLIHFNIAIAWFRYWPIAVIRC